MSEKESKTERPAVAGGEEPAEELAAYEAESTCADETETAALVAEAQERALRAQAELENFRRRARQELEEAMRYASAPLLRELLAVIDNLSRAIDAGETAESQQGMLEGVQMVNQQLCEVLAKHGCESIDALHQPFDPNLHEAISQMPDLEFPAGTVVAVVQTGFRLHDRLLRPAQVIVSTGQPAAEADDSAPDTEG